MSNRITEQPFCKASVSGSGFSAFRSPNFNNKKMKVFKFYCGELYYAYAAQTKEEAIEQFAEETGDQYTAIDEIPESEWDKKMISVWEDNNFDKKPFKNSIRESIVGTEPQQIFSNDFGSW